MTERATHHFNPKHDKMMHCPCCGEGQLSIATLLVLETVRMHFGVPVTITSGPRCTEHNKKVGGAEWTSQHLYEPHERDPAAADIVVRGVPPNDVYDFLCRLPYANLLGIGGYTEFTHVDTRGYKARW